MSGPAVTGGAMLSVLAHDPATQSLGVALASSGVAIGARCPHLSIGKAVVTSQGFTNLKVGPLALDLVECGLSGREVLQALRQHDRWMDFRQIAIVAANGEVDAHTGPMNTGWAGHVSDPGLVCLGNGLPDAGILEAMRQACRERRAAPLTDQLLAALQAGRAALGAEPALLSGALMIRSPGEGEQIDLRVDLAAPGGCAVADLARLLEVYRPLAAVYEQRSRKPDPT